MNLAQRGIKETGDTKGIPVFQVPRVLKGKKAKRELRELKGPSPHGFWYIRQY